MAIASSKLWRRQDFPLLLPLDLNATVHVETEQQQVPYDETFSALLPSVEVQYSFTSQWTAYARAAQGFLAPNENFFNYNSPSASDFQPEKTWNCQASTAAQLQNLATSADIYYTQFTNFITATAVGGNTVPINLAV